MSVTAPQPSPVASVLRATLRNLLVPIGVATVAQAAFGVPELVGAALALSTVLVLNLPDLSRRRLNPIAFGVLLNIVLGAFLLLAGVHVVLVRQAAFSGTLALVVLVSFFAPRPLTFYIGRQLFTGGDAQAVAQYDTAWQFAAGRRVHRFINSVWAAAFGTQVVLALAMLAWLHGPALAIVAPVVLVGITAATLIWTVVWAQRQQRRLASPSVASAGAAQSAVAAGSAAASVESGVSGR